MTQQSGPPWKTKSCCIMPEAQILWSWTDTNMYQTDSRDRAADRDAEAYDSQRYFRTGEQIVADDRLFRENPRLVKLRAGMGTYGYCAWCDAAVSSPTALWNHYETVHSVSMQAAPYTPPSVWQTLLGREMGARIRALCCTRKGVEVLGDSGREQGLVIMDRGRLPEWASCLGGSQ